MDRAEQMREAAAKALPSVLSRLRLALKKARPNFRSTLEGAHVRHEQNIQKELRALPLPVTEPADCAVGSGIVTRSGNGAVAGPPPLPEPAKASGAEEAREKFCEAAEWACEKWREHKDMGDLRALVDNALDDMLAAYDKRRSLTAETSAGGEEAQS